MERILVSARLFFWWTKIQLASVANLINETEMGQEERPEENVLSDRYECPNQLELTSSLIRLTRSFGSCCCFIPGCFNVVDDAVDGQHFDFKDVKLMIC